MRRRASIAARAALIAGILVSSAPAVAADGPVTLQQLRALGQRTLKRLETEAASWTAFHSFLNTEIMVDVIRHGTMQKWDLYEGTTREKRIGRIIVRDGRWYVDADGLTPGIYKPSQAPLLNGRRYTALYRSQLRAIDEYGNPGTTLVSTKGTVAVLRSPWPESIRDLLVQHIKRLESTPATPADLKQGMNLAEYRKLLTDGIQMTVDVDTGLVSSWAKPLDALQIRSFRWLPKVSDKEFDVDATKWEDHTGDIAGQSPSELALMFHMPADVLQSKNIQFGDLLLVNLKTGQQRRVPYHAGAAMYGCFSKDRGKAYVAGVEPNSDRVRLVEVDLQTGKNRPIADAALAFANVTDPALSPDGAKLAALSVKNGIDLEPSQVCVIDLATQQVSKVGKPDFFESMSWLPDSSGLILVRKVVDKVKKRTARTVCRLSLDGQLDPLIIGGSAKVLGSSGRIIFNQPVDNSMIWKTCDRNGGDVRTIGKGLASFRFPAPSADGGHAIMLKIVPGYDDVPVIVQMKSGKAVPLSLGPGIWSMPFWE